MFILKSVVFASDGYRALCTGISQRVGRDKLTGAEKNKLSNTLGGVYEKRLINGKYEVIHLFNNTDEEKCFNLDGEIVAVGGYGSVRESKAIVPACSMAYFVVEKK